MKTWFLLASLFTAKTPEVERQRVLEKFFEPRPNKMLRVLDRSALINSKEPFTIKGELWVRPPKGTCLLLRSDYSKADQRICKPTLVNWELQDLDATGRLTFLVLTEESWDEGTHLRWQTPYRVANVVAFGEQETGNFEDVPIRQCTAKVVEGERIIVLETFTGKKWTIYLPDSDQPAVPDLKEAPKLLINLDSAQIRAEEAAKPQEKKDQEKKDKASKPAEAPTSALAQLLTKGYKEEEKQYEKFHVPKRDAFEMESGRFSETGSPRGMTGRCRYKFKGAAGDPESGIIECFNTDTMDSIFTLVTCFPQLKPRPEADSARK